MPFSLVRNDIVNMRVDAIVNAANSSLAPGGGVCGAIFAAAGRTALKKACRAIGHCDVGSAVITPGFNLPARYVIHAVGPIWQGGTRGEAALLQSCYTRALHLAQENGCESIAFPLISSGIFGYPKPQALRVAINAIEEFLLKYEMQVYLVIFDRAALLISERLYENIQRYIDDRYVELRAFPRQAAEALPHARQRAEQADFPARKIQPRARIHAQAHGQSAHPLFRHGLAARRGPVPFPVFARNDVHKSIASQAAHWSNQYAHFLGESCRRPCG